MFDAVVAIKGITFNLIMSEEGSLKESVIDQSQASVTRKKIKSVNITNYF